MKNYDSIQKRHTVILLYFDNILFIFIIDPQKKYIMQRDVRENVLNLKKQTIEKKHAGQ